MDNVGDNVCLVRHAQSLFNLWDQWKQKLVLTEELTAEEAAFVTAIKDKFDIKFLDAPLSQIGVKQACAAQAAVNKLSIKYVIVSPLVRALETVRLMFASHPQRSEIQVIVQPLIRELFTNPDDIPDWTLKKNKAKYASLGPLQFDFSLIETNPRPGLYFLDSAEVELREKVLQRVANEGEDKYPQIMVDAMREKWMTAEKHKKKLESFANARKRTQEFVYWLKTVFIPTHKATLQEIAVVCHSTFLSCLVASEFNAYGKPVCEPILNATPFAFNISSLFVGH